jgi:hypothetical protein
MNATVKQQWVTALRSGAYAQGQSWLRQIAEDDQIVYCCLGVLCDLHRQATGAADWRPIWTGSFAYADQIEFLPARVRDWAGLGADARLVVPDIVDEPVELALTYLNDERGLTFAQIADLIDAYL